MTPGAPRGPLRRWLDALRGRGAPAAPESGEKATPTDKRMMARALELAHAAAEAGETPVGAVVYETASGDVLAEAHNLREGPSDPAGHAELIAIRAAAARIGDWRLNGCTLVVTLEPCAMCAGLIVNARIGRLVYGARDPKAGAVESLYRLCEDARLNHRITPIAGVMEQPCGEILRCFFRERRAAKKRGAGDSPQRHRGTEGREGGCEGMM